ncbi:MAG: site-2 protease family protein [Gemmataceae bacterium]|nr:site-2 protease family protein [Gemmataceae bacterium]
MDSQESADRNDNVTPPPAETAAEDVQTIREWLARNGSIIAIFVIGVALLYVNMGPQGLFNIFLVAVGLGLVIFIHELGHFAVAKWCDVHVQTFSIGFGPPLPGCHFVKGETSYMIALVPLGGYVKMVGEGSETEEDDSDPRSFKNKKVWQRMAIISAGVVMNVILGCICFIFVYMTHGEERPPGVIDSVDAGSATWEVGAQSGNVIYRIGDVSDPNFEQLIPTVALSGGRTLDFWYGPPREGDQSSQITKTTITPRMNNDKVPRPLIGISPPGKLTLPPERAQKDLKKPVMPGSAADKAQPAFGWGDTIVAMTDPATGKVTKLRTDPRYPDNPQPDYFEFRQRMTLLADKPVEIAVRRHDALPDATPEVLLVPRANYYKFGFRMQMGQIIALRKDSAAAKACVEAKNLKGQVKGDKIKTVEVDAPGADGKVWRWVHTIKSPPDRNVTEFELDPTRLPYDLQNWRDQWAIAHAVPGSDLPPSLSLPFAVDDWQVWFLNNGPRKRLPEVRLTVMREDQHAPAGSQDKTFTLLWDDHFRFDRELPMNSAAMALPALGIAYQVTTTIDSVTDGSPATRVKRLDDGSTVSLQKGDEIVAICGFAPGKDGNEPQPSMKTKFFFITNKAWSDKLPSNHWAQQFYAFQHGAEVKKLLLRIGRAGETFEVEIAPEEDSSWAMADRGIHLTQQIQLNKAKNLGEALTMGFTRTFSFIGRIYRMLAALVTGDLSFRNMSGPIGIADTAYAAVDHNFFSLIFFLGVISVNLAVVNFLPIPVLDGGHMVFLIYEAVRGKPASETVRLGATYVGLFCILALMLSVIVLDVTRYFF